MGGRSAVTNAPGQSDHPVAMLRPVCIMGSTTTGNYQPGHLAGYWGGTYVYKRALTKEEVDESGKNPPSNLWPLKWGYIGWPTEILPSQANVAITNLRMTPNNWFSVAHSITLSVSLNGGAGTTAGLSVSTFTCSAFPASAPAPFTWTPPAGIQSGDVFVFTATASGDLPNFNGVTTFTYTVTVKAANDCFVTPPANGDVGTCPSGVLLESNTGGCHFHCSSGYQLAGAPSATTCSGGVLTKEVCTVIPPPACSGFTLPSNAWLGTCPSTMQPGTTCHLGCNTSA
jgi:hypothetical protein